MDRYIRVDYAGQILESDWKMKSLHDMYLSAKPSSQVLVSFVSAAIIVLIGILFPDPKIPFYSITKIFGFILILGGLWLHGLSHKVHKQAHRETKKIEKLVTTGIYSKIRHPGYLGLIFVFIGVPLAWGPVSLFIPAFLSSYWLYVTTKREEKSLKDKFGKEYEEYMGKVGGFIPRIKWKKK